MPFGRVMTASESSVHGLDEKVYAHYRRNISSNYLWVQTPLTGHLCSNCSHIRTNMTLQEYCGSLLILLFISPSGHIIFLVSECYIIVDMVIVTPLHGNMG